MQIVSSSCGALSWCSLASFLLFSRWIWTDAVHHGGRMNGHIFSISMVAYSGKLRTIYFRLEITLSLLDLMARSMQKEMGFPFGRVCILVNVLRILLWSLIWAGGKAVSTSRAGVDVVLKHPIIAFIAMRCADLSLLSCVGACILPYFGGQYKCDVGN